MKNKNVTKSLVVSLCIFFLVFLFYIQEASAVTEKEKEKYTESNTLLHENSKKDGETLYEIGDFIWEDTNKNGRQDKGERGIPGVEIQLKNDKFNVVQTVRTDKEGRYLFKDLQKGLYFYNVKPPKGYHYTISRNNTDGNVDSDGPSASADVTDENRYWYDFGFVKDEKEALDQQMHHKMSNPEMDKKETESNKKERKEEMQLDRKKQEEVLMKKRFESKKMTDVEKVQNKLPFQNSEKSKLKIDSNNIENIHLGGNKQSTIQDQYGIKELPKSGKIGVDLSDLGLIILVLSFLVLHLRKRNEKFGI
ncbi:TPA: SdrD B-like domain-containing protein [Staphylococcus aureus]